jgi:hypothetical protein
MIDTIPIHRRQPARIALFAALGSLLVGCPNRADRYDDAVGLSSPIDVRGALLYASAGRRSLILINPETRDIQVVATTGIQTWVTAIGDKSRVLSLNTASETVDVIEVATGTRTTWSLDSAFDSIVVSDDGRYAIASFKAGQRGGLSNAAEVAVIALEEPPSDTNPTVRTVASAGGVPSGIFVTPAFGPTDQRLALISSTNHIAAIDLTAPTGTTRSIPLVPTGSTANVTARDVEYRATATGLDVFVLSSELNDVIHLRFTGAAVDGAPLPTLNQFAVGNNPTQLEVWERSDGVVHIITVNAGTRDMAVVDVESARTTTLPLGVVNRLLLHETPTGTQALAWATGGQIVYRVALEDIETKKTKAVTPLSLVNSIANITPVAQGDWLLATHSAGSQATATLVSSDGGDIVPFTGSGQVRQVAVSADSNQVFLMAGSGQTSLGVIDVATGHPESVDFGDWVEGSMRRIEGTDWLAFSYGSTLGRVRLVDTSKPLSTGVVLENFALTGLLDEEVE